MEQSLHMAEKIEGNGMVTSAGPAATRDSPNLGKESGRYLEHQAGSVLDGIVWLDRDGRARHDVLHAAVECMVGVWLRVALLRGVQAANVGSARSTASIWLLPHHDWGCGRGWLGVQQSAVTGSGNFFI